MKKELFRQNTSPLLMRGICHRGLHNESFTENGMLAFENAMKHHMAFELDIHLTTDNELIVCHDSELLRTTGKKGVIERLSSNEIRRDYRLLDGEVIPTLREVLERTNERVPIVIELKVYEKNYKPLAKRLADELKSIQDKKNIVLISFDPRALFPFKGSGFMRELLVAHDGKHDYVYHFRRFFEGVDLEYTFLSMKKVRRYQKHHMVNIWTVESMEVLKSSLPYCDQVTFQHLDAEEVKSLLQNK